MALPSEADTNAGPVSDHRKRARMNVEAKSRIVTDASDLGRPSTSIVQPHRSVILARLINTRFRVISAALLPVGLGSGRRGIGLKHCQSKSHAAGLP